MKYCKTTTENHPLATQYPHCVEELNSIFANEGYTGEGVLFNQEQTGINLDSIEEERSKSLPRQRGSIGKSIDFTFGVNNTSTDEKYMVLTELKLNHVDVRRNLKYEEIEGKITASLRTIADDTEVLHQYYFLFSDSVIEQARYKFSRLYPGINRSRVASTVTEWHDLFFA